MDQTPPLRTFEITHPALPTVLLRAHLSQVDASGALHILRYVDEIPWTIQTFAKSAWFAVTCSLPTDEDIAVLRQQSEYRQKTAMAEAFAQKEQLRMMQQADAKVPLRRDN